MKQKILDISIKHWNERFVGISAIDVSKKLNIPHENAMLLLEELKKENKGSLNENVTLGLLSINIDDETTDDEMPKLKQVTTHFFFPSKEILEHYFHENIKDFYPNGEYLNRLHCGYNQLELIYFDIKVLSKYLNNKEIYSLNDDATGGFLRLNSAYKSTISEDDIDEIWFDKVWYGKRRLINGYISVAASTQQLSRLPKKEQNYWAGFEIENPIFIDYDPDFNRFLLSFYDGDPTESKDPIQAIESAIEGINKILKFDLFNKSKNPYLGYPINNTYKEFVDCNSELYKIIGPDNIKNDNLTKIYLNYCKGIISDLVHKDKDRKLSSMQVIELILNKLNPQLLEVFKIHWEKVKENRISGDHRITYPYQEQKNYYDLFCSICYDTNEILRSIKFEFAKFEIK